MNFVFVFMHVKKIVFLEKEVKHNTNHVKGWSQSTTRGGYTS